MPKKKTESEFLQEVYDLTKNEYTFLQKYTNYKTKMKVRHNECGNEFKVRPAEFFKRWKCPICNKTDRKGYSRNTRTPEQFRKEYQALTGDEYLFLEDYNGIANKISVVHNVCGYKYKVSPDNFLRNRRCPSCSRENNRKRWTKSHEQFVSEVRESHGEEYTVIGEYKDTQTKIRMRHNACKKEYEMSPAVIIAGGRCLNCSYSKGESEISAYLENHNISFVTQYRNTDCRYKRPLPFDFALLDSNYEVRMIIEYDGIQHYIPQRFNGSTSALENFELQKMKDNIKDTYCRENNIPLLRIPYWDFDNIEEILSSKLPNKLK